ncbi:MAG: fibronectin type III domain-containing protein [Nitrospira sp.]|nr:MAG: fibronectin type III domain-containing protein [Nitrospira sp.]
MTSRVTRIILCVGIALQLASCSGGGSSTPAESAPAATATSSALFEWDANTETDLAGYKIYKGVASGQFGAPIATLPPSATSYEAAGLQNGAPYFFVVTAFDTSGNEGPLSNELSVTIP